MSEELERSLGRVEAKVDILLANSENINKRVAAVEKKVWWLSGVSAAIAFVTAKVMGH